MEIPVEESRPTVASASQILSQHWPHCRDDVQYGGGGKFISVVAGLLYIGDMDVAIEALQSDRRLVSHVLSVCNRHPLAMAPSGYHEYTAENGTESLWIATDDDFKEDLVGSGKLLRAVSWVRRAVFEADGIVLVHCAFGVSRSAAFIAATLLVDLLDWRLVAQLLDMHVVACLPNEHFLSQLMWLSSRLMKIAGGASPRATADLSSARAYYRCAKCKSRLFTDADVAVHWHRVDSQSDVCTQLWISAQEQTCSNASLGDEHTEVDGVAVHDAATTSTSAHDAWTPVESADRLHEERRRMTVFRMATSPESLLPGADDCVAPDGSRPCAPKYLLKDAPDWLEPTGEITDKVLCPFVTRTGGRCGAKLGKFDWAGRPCKMDGCGARIDPWFHISPDKVDRMLALDSSQ